MSHAPPVRSSILSWLLLSGALLGACDPTGRAPASARPTASEPAQLLGGPYTTPTTLYLPTDADGDGYDVDEDCNDNNSAIHPDAVEVVGDSVDQNCDGREICYLDSDNDGARHAAATTLSSNVSCSDALEGTSTDPIDCDDNDSSRYPGAVEIVGDGVDEDCTGTELCYLDTDDDGARSSSFITSTDADCTDVLEATYADPLDCNDNNSAVHPGAVEILCDGLDNDCDPASADGPDLDADGWNTCVDCNDSDGSVNPGANEIAADGVDSDCDGSELCYADDDGDGFGEAEVAVTDTFDCDEAGLASSNDDVCPGYDDRIDPDLDGVPTGCDACPDDVDDDSDGDGVCDSDDICPGADDALDTDGDGTPNGCEICYGGPDSDGDGVPDDCDVCPGGSDVLDSDGDSVADGCDVCPDDASDDSDGDGVCDSDDACPGADDALDSDGDGVPDGCDDVANSVLDSDGDGIPDDVDTDPYSAGGAGKSAPPRPPTGCGTASGAGGSSIALLLARRSRR